MYSKKNTDVKESNTAKGVNIATDFNDFKDTLFNKKVVRHKMRRIQSKKHKIRTYKIKKLSLLCCDNKKFVLDDGIHTLVYFHKDLKKQIHTDDHKKRKEIIRPISSLLIFSFFSFLFYKKILSAQKYVTSKN